MCVRGYQEKAGDNTTAKDRRRHRLDCTEKHRTEKPKSKTLRYLRYTDPKKTSKIKKRSRQILYTQTRTLAKDAFDHSLTSLRTTNHFHHLSSLSSHTPPPRSMQKEHFLPPSRRNRPIKRHLYSTPDPIRPITRSENRPQRQEQVAKMTTRQPTNDGKPNVLSLL
ncbi:hypothetical protein BC567DRAFT_233462 [Phyllosticta citribraziliensis]